MKNLIEVKLKLDDKIIKETLTRIGIANKKEKILYPSCYLYEKDEKYYIAHFKQLFTLERDSAYENMSEEDIKRRNAIIFCLKQWGLIEVDESKIDPHDTFVFILSHKQKSEWSIQHKYNTKSLSNYKKEEEEEIK